MITNMLELEVDALIIQIIIHIEWIRKLRDYAQKSERVRRDK